MATLTKTQTAVVTNSGICRQVLSGDGTSGSGSLEGPAMTFAYQQSVADVNVDGWIFGEYAAQDGDYIQLGDSTPFRRANGSSVFGYSSPEPSGYSAIGSRVAFFHMSVVDPDPDYLTRKASIQLSIPAAGLPHGGFTLIGGAGSNVPVQLGQGDADFETFNWPTSTTGALQNHMGDRIDLFVYSDTGAITIRVAVGFRSNAYTAY